MVGKHRSTLRHLVLSEQAWDEDVAIHFTTPEEKSCPKQFYQEAMG